MTTVMRTRHLLRAGAILLVVAALFATLSIGNGRMLLSPDGVHEAIALPLAPGNYVKFPTFAGMTDRASVPGYLDGPVVRRLPDGSWQASWFCEDRVHHRSGRDNQLDIDCGGRSRHVLLGPTANPPASIATAPERLVVISDLEGNLDFLNAALRELKIVDEAGNWGFGSNQLLVLGDSVDRGRDVSGVLWRLHGLAQQAQRDSGAVHVLAGNHEQYLIQGKMQAVHPLARYSARMLGGYAAVYGADTVLGEWLRQRPVAVRIGTALFVHGGISPTVTAYRMDIEQLNGAMRAYWQGPRPSTAALDSILGRHGVTQYRGLVESLPPDYPAATRAQVESALRHFGVERIIVGHTIVPAIRSLHEGKVIAVDVNSAQSRSEVLVFDHGRPRIVTLAGARGLEPEQRHKTNRPLRLGPAGDWEAIWQTIASSYRLAQLPQSY